MLHEKFHGNCSTGSGEEVLKVFTIYGRGGHIAQTMTLTFSPTNLHLLIKTTLFTIFVPESSKLSMKSYVLAFSHI